MAALEWREIEAQQTGGHRRHRRHHDQPVTNICTEAQKDWMKARLGDTFGDRDLFRFRLSGEQRLWGYRVGATFHVVWWDPDHLVYPTEKN